MGWKLVGVIQKQSIVLIGLNGDQEFDEMNCCVLNNINGNQLQFPRLITRNNKKFVIIRYSKKQDLVFYKLEK